MATDHTKDLGIDLTYLHSIFHFHARIALQLDMLLCEVVSSSDNPWIPVVHQLSDMPPTDVLTIELKTKIAEHVFIGLTCCPDVNYGIGMVIENAGQ